MTSSKVFIPDETFVWLAGEIVGDENESGFIDVRIIDSAIPKKNDRRSISLKKCGLTAFPLQNLDLPRDGVDDMCELNYLHEPSILDNLRRFTNY